MKGHNFKWLSYNYPQTYILRHPLAGALIISLFVFGFTSLYKPFNVHATKVLSFETTMAIYSFLPGIFLYIVLRTLKAFEYFSNEKKWTVFREIISVLLILLVLGLAIYFLGFLIESEPSANRWRVSTLLNSLGSAFLIGIIPLTFFIAVNYRYLFAPVISSNETDTPSNESENVVSEDLIQISSQLKKEDLSFYPGEFLYAESDGNYVIFHLLKDNVLKKESIRNSINSISQQLSGVPYFFRTHRAFLVNLKKVKSKQGNSLGYVIKLTGTDIRLPVSRTNTSDFNRLFTRFHA
jgi:hypothetical protein